MEVINNSIPLSLNKKFEKTLKEKMKFYNSPDCDKLLQAQGEVDELTDIMTRNLEKVLDRGFKLDVIVEKTKDMQENANLFKKNAVKIN